MSINYLEKITELYAFVSVDEGGEGVVAQMVPDPDGSKTFLPFVCSDKARVNSLRPLVQEMVKASGRKIKLIRLTVREELEEF